MIPYTVSIYKDVWHIDEGIPIAKYMNISWYLPDGRRLMTGTKRKASQHLVSQTEGFRFYKPVTAIMAYPKVVFAEGEQPWISLLKAGNDKNILLYFDVRLPSDYSIKTFGLEPDAHKLEWLLPFQPSWEGSPGSHGGLVVLKPGQVSSLLVTDPTSQKKLIRVIASERYWQPMLGYAI